MTETTFKADPESFLTSTFVSFFGLNYGSLEGSSKEGLLFNLSPRLQPDPADRTKDDLFLVVRNSQYVLDVQILPDSIKAQYPGTIPLGLAISKGGVDTGVRFLMWRENRLTGSLLDSTATWIFTGPLQGCNIYVATVAGGADGAATTALLHANASDVADETENERLKDEKANAFVAAIGGGTINRRLTRRDYAPTTPGIQYNGFVFGRKQPKGAWEFFIYRITMNEAGSVTGRRVDPLPLA